MVSSHQPSRAASRQSRFIYGRLALIAVFLLVAAWQWPQPARASGSTIDIMPAAWRSAGTVLDYGLHYDEAGYANRGAYDYSPSDSDYVWLRGRAAENLTLPTRYMYWKESSCLLRARLQRYVSELGDWVDWYQYDLHIRHLENMPQYVSYTSTIYYSGNWFYHVVGDFSDCGLQTGQHAHLSAIPSQYVSVYSKSDDTCWDDNNYCDIGDVREHVDNSCPGGDWDGYASKSGDVDEYICATWQGEWRSVDLPAFRIQ